MKAKKEEYDVLVCGGGMAGLALVRQLNLSQPDLSVLLFDKMSRPLPVAFKVGESTTETSAYYFREVLKLESYLDEHQLRKLGLRYFFGDPHGKFQDRPEFGLSEYAPVKAYQLDRGVIENDLRMINHDAGVELIEDCTVQDIVLSETGEPHEVLYSIGSDKQTHRVKGRWVIDAMGRRRLIQRKLGLAMENEKNCSAAWFRIKDRIDVADFVPESERWWHDRVPGKLRYYSTTHLMGNGYWVWLIALSSGHTSVGIVTTEEIHPFSEYNTSERAYRWLENNEPAVARRIKGATLVDFLLMRNYSYSTSQAFSENRWGCVGEAAAFTDPFYSPGMEQIGFSNSLACQLIQQDREGRLSQEAVDEANVFYIAYNNIVTHNIQMGYPFFGSELAMGAKLLWDFVMGWSFTAPLMFNSIFLDSQRGAKIRKVTGRFFPLLNRVQKLFAEWSKKSLHRGSYEFFDYLDIPFAKELRLRNLKTNKTDEELVEDHIASLEVLEELAQIFFLIALADSMPEMLPRLPSPVWLNAWAVSLDPERWEEDGLFNPISEPRDLSVIMDQVMRQIRFPETEGRDVKGQ